MSKFFQVTFFLLSLISFGPQGYASYASDDNAAALAPILIQQIEEGWRWRQNLDITVRQGDQTCLVQGKDIHTQMQTLTERVRKMILPAGYSKNLAAAAITIVYQDAEGNLQQKTSWIQEVQDIPAGAVGAHIMEITGMPDFFLSNSSGKHLKRNFSEARLAQHLSPKTMRPHLIHFFRPIIDYPSVNILELLIAPFSAESFSRDWQHSEQKLMYSLWNHQGARPYRESHLYQTIAALLNPDLQASQIPFVTLKAVILHVHTRNDPCMRCASTLRLFAEKAQNGLRELQGKNSNSRFIVTVSGGVVYEGSRTERGHDGEYINPIEINMNEEFRPSNDPRYVNFAGVVPHAQAVAVHPQLAAGYAPL